MRANSVQLIECGLLYFILELVVLFEIYFTSVSRAACSKVSAGSISWSWESDTFTLFQSVV